MMDRRTAGIEIGLLWLCAALTSGCGAPATAPSCAESLDRGTISEASPREPRRLNETILSTGYRAAPAIAPLPGADQAFANRIDRSRPFDPSTEPGGLSPDDYGQPPITARDPEAVLEFSAADQGGLERLPEVTAEQDMQQQLSVEPYGSAQAPGAAPELDEALDALAAAPPVDLPLSAPVLEAPSAMGPDAEVPQSAKSEAAVTDAKSSEPTLPGAAEPDLAVSAAPRTVAPESDMTESESPADNGTEPLAVEPLERLPPVARPRSPEMDAVARQAESLVREGFRLGERGAAYSGRRKFYDALGLIARSLDLAEGSQAATQALTAGRIALVEARQFTARGTAETPNLARLVATHRTPVLKNESLEGLSPVVVERRYYTYAQSQLALAASGETTASLALYGLGKIAPQASAGGSVDRLSVLGEQVVCYQAALLANPRNFLAANELGVILADNGRAEQARDLFASSAQAAQQSAIYHNLAVVLAKLGDQQGAALAERRAVELQATRNANVFGGNLRWVDPSTFAQTVSPSEGLLPPASIVAPAQSPAPTQPAAAQTKKRTAMRLPWTTR